MAVEYAEAPRRQTRSPAPGKDPHDLGRQFAFFRRKSRGYDADQDRRCEDARQYEKSDDERQQRSHGSSHAIGFLAFVVGQQ